MAAEYDTVLVEVAGSILGPLARVAGGDRFLNLFEQILTKLLAKLVGECNIIFTCTCRYNNMCKHTKRSFNLSRDMTKLWVHVYQLKDYVLE